MMNYLWAGQCNYQLGHFDEALTHYDLAAKFAASKKEKTAPDETIESDILFNRGMNYCSLEGNHNLYKAIEDFEGALLKQVERENSVKHKTLFNLGIVYRKLGVQTVLHDIPERLQLLAKAEKNGILKESIVKLREAERNATAITKAATLNNLGLSLFDLADYYEAETCFKNAR
mgnify:CR=1 FL=1